MGKHNFYELKSFMERHCLRSIIQSIIFYDQTSNITRPVYFKLTTIKPNVFLCRKIAL